MNEILLLNISKYLDSENKFNLIKLSSKVNDILRKSKIMESIKYNKKKIDINKFKKYITYITELDIRYCKINFDVQLFNYSKLVKLDIYGVKIKIQDLLHIIKESKLKHLNIKWQKINNNNLYFISQLQRNTLVNLNISTQKKFKFTIDSTSNLHNLLNLKVLNIRNNSIKKDYLFRILKELKNLKVLDIRNIRFYGRCICYPYTIVQKLNNLKRLDKLILSNNTFCDNFNQILINYLQNKIEFNL